MSKKILGIDIGISSVGWALVELSDASDTNSKSGKIIASGVRIFTRAENPENGESLSKPRRDARLTRRRNRRRNQRLSKIKDMFITYGLIMNVPRDKINQIYICNVNSKDPWTLRKESLYRELNGEELARVLTHIAKRRGFKSMRKSEVADTDAKAKETKKMLFAIQQIKDRLLKEGKYQTVGEMFASASEYMEAKRNKPDSYINSIPRELLEDETHKIFQKQREFKSELATEKFEKEYCEVTFTQKPIQSMANMVGNCIFEKGEKRAPKQSYSAEIFSLLCKINNIILKPQKADRDDRLLTQEEREKIFQLCHKNAKVTFKQIRSEINLSDNWHFNLVNYTLRKRKSATDEEEPEKETFFEMKGYHDIRKSVTKNCGAVLWDTIKVNANILNIIATTLATEKNDEDIIKKLKEKGLEEKIINSVLELNFKKFIHLSLKALDKINPYLRKGLKYTEACIKAGYNPLKPDQSGAKNTLLPKLTPEQEEQITSPVVKRAVTQFRKVLNAIIRQYGKLEQMNIELARELSNSYEKRMEIQRGQKEYQAEKEMILKECSQNEIDPDQRDNLLKYRLWKQQDGVCIYCGQPIELKRLQEQGYAEIDHILPYSRSLDDSINNKVLCHSQDNQHKKNQIPFEYFGGDGNRWEEFINRVNTYKNLPKPKRNRLLKRKFDEKDMENYKERNINDTRYISRFIKDWVENNLEFTTTEQNRQKVFVRSGALTAFLRHQWGLTKNRDESDKHHALDAIVIACSTQGMVQFISNVSQRIESYDWLNKMRPRFEPPWPTFREDVLNSLEKIFVSRAPRRKVTGAAHEETIRSGKYLQYGFTVVKTPLTSIKLKDLENMLNKNNSQKLYETLKSRLEQFNNDPKKAFGDPNNPPRMPTNSGKPGPIIRSIKIKTSQKSGLQVRKGIADNGEMVRVDVFEKKGKFYLVPIYVSDFTKKELPNRAIAAGKPENEWPIMDKTYTFKFTLYKDDLIEINPTGKPQDLLFGYFKGAHRGTGAINIESHDRSKIWNGKSELAGIGARTLKSFRKFHIDLLGNYFEIKKEKRIGIIRKNVLANNTNIKTI